jgi:hypothetical protein
MLLRRIVRAGAAVLVAAVFAAWTVTAASHNDVAVDVRLAAAKPTPAPGTGAGTFLVAGDVNGLFPSDTPTTAIAVTVSNPNSFAIVVSNLAVAVSDASPTCTAANLVITTPDGSFTIPARKATVRSLPVRLVKSAPDACQSAAFPLLYSATAAKS